MMEANEQNIDQLFRNASAGTRPDPAFAEKLWQMMPLQIGPVESGIIGESGNGNIPAAAPAFMKPFSFLWVVAAIVGGSITFIIFKKQNTIQPEQSSTIKRRDSIKNFSQDDTVRNTQNVVYDAGINRDGIDSQGNRKKSIDTSTVDQRVPNKISIHKTSVDTQTQSFRQSRSPAERAKSMGQTQITPSKQTRDTMPLSVHHLPFDSTKYSTWNPLPDSIAPRRLGKFRRIFPAKHDTIRIANPAKPASRQPKN